MMNTFTVWRASAGTGKTYSLSARYIALLMDAGHDFAYRNILAVTFTNKATAEMKQRILSYLYVIAEGGDADSGRSEFIANMRGFMKTAPKGGDTAWLRDKAGRIYHNILDDYDNMKVATIDSFLQTLINGMAHTIGIGALFNVVLDSKHVIAEAVDEVMTSYILENPKARAVLTGYVEEQLEDEKRWNIRDLLIEMGQEMLRETVLKEDNHIVFANDVIMEYRKSQKEDYLKVRAVMADLVGKVEHCEQDGEIDKGKNYYSFIKRMLLSLKGKAKGEDAYRGLTENQKEAVADDKFLAKIKSSTPQRAEEIQKTLLEIDRLCPKVKERFLRFRILTEFLNDLAMMGFVKDCVDVRLRETNSILLARTAYVLSKALKPGDADFILEKAGIRYSHIMIDEFQDTSTLQWEIFRNLVGEVLSSGGTTLIVGDVKQSIYRWRNGDYTIMAGLGPDVPGLGTYYDRDAKALTRNFRSRSNVVKFNLSLFKNIVERNLVGRGQPDGGMGLFPKGFFDTVADIYKEGREGYDDSRISEFHKYGAEENGYVQFRAYPFLVRSSSKYKNRPQNELKSKAARRFIVDGMFEDIAGLIDSGAKPSDMMILIRKNRELAEIMEGYNRSPFNGRVRICSNDSFLLGSSETVQIIVNSLKYIIKGDGIAKEYLAVKGIAEDCFAKCDAGIPLYELMETIVADVLSDSDGNLIYPDSAYVNCFMDYLRGYVGKYGSDAGAFLTYWNDELHSKAVPASSADGIRIMTIHTAKGLESRHLFIPFCNWNLKDDKGKLWVDVKNQYADGAEDEGQLKFVPVRLSENIAECGYAKDYLEEKASQYIDNLNLLYVALTRAADNLFVYSPLSSKVTEECGVSNVGELLFSNLEDEILPGGKSLGEEFDCRFEDYCEGVPAFAQYTLGTGPYIGPDRQETTASPFEYRYSEAETLNYDFHTSTDNIAFRQSQESVLYGSRDENAEAGQKRIDAGILRHNMFAEIKTMSDTEKVLDRYYTKGLIETEDELRSIREEFGMTWKNGRMADWFGGGWKLLREVAILRPQSEYDADVMRWKDSKLREREPMPRRELRPDRVMIKDDKAVVLDFKFGKQNHEKYSRQIRQYADLLRKMGYAEVEGYLWYGFDNELVRVN